MGNKSKTEIQNTIRSEVNTKIVNNTKVINKVMNDSVMEISNEIINKNINEVKQSTVGINEADLGIIRVSGKGKVNINQKVDAKTINEAVGSITNNNEAMAKFADQATTAIETAIKKSQEAKAAMKQNAQLSDSQKDGGGLEKILDSAFKALDNLMKVGETNETNVRNTITNTINITMESNTYNEAENINKMVAKAKANMQNFTQQTCNMTTTAGNKLAIKGIEVSDEGEFTMGQSASVQAFNKCLLTTLNTNSIIADAMKMTETQLKFFQDEAQKADSKAEQEAKITKTVESEASLIKDLGDAFAKNNPFVQMKEMILYGIIGIGALIAVVVIVKAMSGGSQPQYLPPPDYGFDQEGGSEGCGNYVNTILIIIVTVLTLNILMNRKCK